MRKFILLYFLFISSLAIAQSKYTVLSDSVELRDCMKMNCKVVKVLKKDNVFEALKIKDKWLVINLNGKELYTHQLENVAPSVTITYIVKADLLSVRACNQPTCAVIGQIKKGQSISPITEDGNWIKFQWDSLKQGYVYADSSVLKKHILDGKKVKVDSDDSLRFSLDTIFQNFSLLLMGLIVVILAIWYLYIQRDLIKKIPFFYGNQPPVMSPQMDKQLRDKIYSLTNLFESFLYGTTFKQGADGSIKAKRLIKEIKKLNPTDNAQINQVNKLIDTTNRILKRDFKGNPLILSALGVAIAICYVFGWDWSWIYYFGLWGILYFFASLKPEWVRVRDFMKEKDSFNNNEFDFDIDDGKLTKVVAYFLRFGFRILVLPLMCFYYFYINYLYSIRKVGLSSFLILITLLAFVLTYLQLSAIRYGSYKTAELLQKTNNKAYSDFDILYHNSTYLSHSLLSDSKLKIYLSNDTLQKKHLSDIQRLFPDTAQQKKVLKWGEKLAKSCIDKHLIVHHTKKSNAFNVGLSGLQTQSENKTYQRDKTIREKLKNLTITPQLAAHAAYQRIIANEWVAKLNLDSIPQIVKKLVKDSTELEILMKWAKARGKQKEVTNTFTNLKYTVRPAPPDVEWFYHWALLDEWCLEKEAFAQRKKEILTILGGSYKFTHSIWGNLQSIGKTYAEKRYKRKDNFLPPKSERAYLIAGLDVLSGIDPVVSDSSKNIFREMFIGYEIIGGDIYNNFSLVSINRENNDNFSFVLDETAIPPFLYFYNSEDFFLRHSIPTPALYPSQTPYAIIDDTTGLHLSEVKSPDLENRLTFLGITNTIFTLFIAVLILILFHLFSLGVSIFLPQTIKSFLVDRLPKHFKEKLEANEIFIKFRKESIVPFLNKKSKFASIFTYSFLAYIFVSKWFGLNSEYVVLHPHNFNFYLLFFLSVFFATFFINILTTMVANALTVCFILAGKNPEKSFWDDVLGVAMTFLILAFYGYDPANFWLEVLFGAIRPILIDKTEKGLKNKTHITYLQKFKHFFQKTKTENPTS